MKEKPKEKPIDTKRIAGLLGAERRGPVEAAGGYFGALQLASDIRSTLRRPERGGRATNPEWTERRLLPLSPQTLAELERLAAHFNVAPMQVAAVFVEQGIQTNQSVRREMPPAQTVVVHQANASVARSPAPLGKRRVSVPPVPPGSVGNQFLAWFSYRGERRVPPSIRANLIPCVNLPEKESHAAIQSRDGGLRKKHSGNTMPA